MKKSEFVYTENPVSGKKPVGGTWSSNLIKINPWNGHEGQ